MRGIGVPVEPQLDVVRRRWVRAGDEPAVGVLRVGAQVVAVDVIEGDRA